jgi:hypothetical protein
MGGNATILINILCYTIIPFYVCPQFIEIFILQHDVFMLYIARREKNTTSAAEIQRDLSLQNIGRIRNIHV